MDTGIVFLSCRCGREGTDCLDCLSPSSRPFIWSCSSGFGVCGTSFCEFCVRRDDFIYCSLCDRFQFCMACVNTEFLRHCDHCDMILCAFCQKIHRDREGSHSRQGEGSDSGGTTLACSLCNLRTCDHCMKKTMGKAMAGCAHSDTVLCRLCHVWQKGQGKMLQFILAINVVQAPVTVVWKWGAGHAQICFFTGCNAVLSRSCHGKDQGQSKGKGTNTATTTIFGPCSLCDATSCDGCLKWNPLYLVMLCCNSCGTKVCQQCNEGGGKGAVIHACDRCRRRFCGSCVAEYHHCSSKSCQPCNGEEKKPKVPFWFAADVNTSPATSAYKRAEARA